MPANTNYQNTGSSKFASVWDNSTTLADEGTFFVAQNPTVGTAIAMVTSVVDDAATASSTHAQSSPYIYIQNRGALNDPNGKSLYLRYIKLFSRIADQAWTSATQALYSFRADPTGDRRTTVGTALAIVNANTGSGTGSAASISAGGIVASLPSASLGRVQAHGLIQSSIPLAGSTWIWTFGDPSSPASFGYASVVNSLTIPVAPIVLAPGWSLQLDLWATALAAAPTFELEIGYAERYSGL
jgi:hypothetical protein